MATWTKDQTAKLIEILEDYPNVYSIKHQEYTNRNKRQKSLEEILDKIKFLKPNANIRDIRLKLRTLRSQYSKERSQVLRSKKSGAGTDDIYVPKLWCFDLLHFLNDASDDISGESNISFIGDDNSMPQPEYELPSGSSKLDSPLIPKKKRKVCNENALKASAITSINTATNILKQIQENKKEESTLRPFLNMVESEMLSFPLKLQNEIKWKVMDLIKQGHNMKNREEYQEHNRMNEELNSTAELQDFLIETLEDDLFEDFEELE